MRKIFFLLVAIGVAASSAIMSPARLSAESLGTKCYCSGGCENYVYLNPCDNNMCSWACNAT